MEHTSFTFSSNNGLSLLGRIWGAQQANPKGIVHLVHGLGEHTARYSHVAEALVEAGFIVVGFDLRGHGLSEGRRGHTPDFEYLLNDMQIFLEDSHQRVGDSLPSFLYGHSLGGVLVINYILCRQPKLTGAIVTSPTLALAYEPSKIKLFLARLMAKLMPTFSLKNGLETTALSRDLAVVKAYEDDVYVHDTLSARLGLDILESGSFALEHAQNWKMPLLLMHGTADRITSHKASRQFADKAGGSVDLVLWEDYYHELQNDLGNKMVIKKLISWLEEKARDDQVDYS